MIKTFNNKTEKVGDDLKLLITKGSEIEIATNIFSIYGYEYLKKELNKLEKFDFIFTNPTFIELDKSKKEQKQFLINKTLRQKSISGSDFEINLKNKLHGHSIARAVQ